MDSLLAVARAACTITVSVGLLIAPQTAWSDPSATRAVRTDAENIELIDNMKCANPVPGGNELTPTEALAIAKKAVAANDAWLVSRAAFKTQRDACGWGWVVAESPGPLFVHRFIRING